MKRLLEGELSQERCKTLDDPQTLHELATVVNHIEEGNQFGGWIPFEKRDAVTSVIQTFRTNYATYQKLNEAEGSNGSNDSNVELMDCMVECKKMNAPFFDKIYLL